VTETTRIRWHHVNGTVVEWFGYVGTMTTTALFQILHPVAEPTEAVMGSRFDEWALCTTFPGESVKARYASDRDETKAVAELKAEAERWLEEFVTSLGAVFPDAAAADLRSRANEMESYSDGGDEGRHDRSMFATGMRRSADLIERGDIPAEPVPPHPEEEN